MKLKAGTAYAAEVTTAALMAITVTALIASDAGVAAPTMSSPPHTRPVVTPLVQYARLDVQAAMPPELTATPFPH